MKNMVNFENFTSEELDGIITLALDMKKNPEKYGSYLKGKKLYELFEKTSTRTYLSFAVGITELGGSYFSQNWCDSNFAIGDTCSEAQYIGRNVDVFMARLKSHELTQKIAGNSTVPFINGCDNAFHPCQAMADYMTIKEIFGSYDKNILYVGAKNNVFNSLVELAGKLGGSIYALTPIKNSKIIADSFYDPYIEANVLHFLPLEKGEYEYIIPKIDAFYTDTWVDMEFFNNPSYSKEKEETLATMLPYQLNLDFLKESKPGSIVMHDMPIHLNYEISAEVVDKYNDSILTQAENRRHAEKAIMVSLCTSAATV